MKIQFIFLVVCVVASFAVPDRNRSVNSELKEQDEQQQEFLSINHGTIVVGDERIDGRNENVDEKTNSSNQTAAERGKINNWITRRHNRRNWLRNGERGRNSTELNNRETRHHPIMHSSVWQQSQTLLPKNRIYGTEESHPRHHHRHHHHHHHKNGTTTTTAPPLTTTPDSTTPTPLSEMEKIAMYRHLTSN